MSRTVITLLLTAILIGGAWALYHREEIRSPEDAWRLLTSNWGEAPAGGVDPTRLPAQLTGWSVPPRSPDSLRVASFKVQSLSANKLADPASLSALASIIRQFDVVAVQDIRAHDPSLLQTLVTAINDGQYHFAFSLSPILENTDPPGRSAFIFNQAVVRLDDAFTYTVNDPQGVMSRPPFVAWFRAAAPRPDRAFTFTLVNVHFQSRRTRDELAYLPQLFRAVRKDGRGEDDILILGDFHAGDRGLIPASQHSGLTWAIRNKPTDTMGQSQLDNVIFDRHATTEFTGQAGVLDFLKDFNLSMEEALRISDHLPVWAEFSIFEGATPGRVAGEEPLPRR